jgi:hypothetical protein
LKKTAARCSGSRRCPGPPLLLRSRRRSGASPAGGVPCSVTAPAPFSRGRRSRRHHQLGVVVPDGEDAARQHALHGLLDSLSLASARRSIVGLSASGAPARARRGCERGDGGGDPIAPRHSGALLTSPFPFSAFPLFALLDKWQRRKGEENPKGRLRMGRRRPRNL